MVRVTGDAHIINVLEMAMPKTRGAHITVTAPFFLDIAERVKHVNGTLVSRNILPGERKNCVHLTRLLRETNLFDFLYFQQSKCP